MKDNNKTKKQLIDELQSLRTEYVQLENKLKDREEKYQAFYENALIPMYVTSMDGGKALEVNRKGVTFAGYASAKEFSEGFITEKY